MVSDYCEPILINSGFFRPYQKTLRYRTESYVSLPISTESTEPIQFQFTTELNFGDGSTGSAKSLN